MAATMPITSISRSPSTLSAAGPRKGTGAAEDEDKDEDKDELLLLDKLLLLLLLLLGAAAAGSLAGSSSSRARLPRRVSMEDENPRQNAARNDLPSLARPVRWISMRFTTHPSLRRYE